MTITVARLDAMPVAEAAFKLAACCGASKWVAGMLAQRPFGSRDRLFEASDEVADTLAEPDWLEAFSHHPRIGQRRSNSAGSTTAESWSTGEQSAVVTASTEVRAALVDANDKYESRFGFIFIICANGRSAEEILAMLEVRMSNERVDEVLVAAREQQRITRLRLEKLLLPNGARA